MIRIGPRREAISLRDAMNQLFEQSMVGPAWGESVPMGVPVDLMETDDDIIVSAEMPGLKADDVEISVQDNTLTMKGEFRTEEEREEGDIHIQERRYGRFQRSVRLPDSVIADQAEAEFDSGVLKVTLPKSEETKPKQIEVKASKM
jgi:HSP20 family protein